MNILKPSITSYFNPWFTIFKKNDTLRFIQDMQLKKKVTIRNMDSSLIIDEFGKIFVRRANYSIEDLYLGYDQFQLAIQSRDFTIIKIPLGLIKMYILPKRATNFGAYIMNGMHKVLRDFISRIIIFFLYNV